MIGVRKRNVTAERLLALKLGLNMHGMLLDGLQFPYQRLLPFITLGCVRLERLEEEEQLKFIDAGPVVEDTLEDVMDMISTMEVQYKMVG